MAGSSPSILLMLPTSCRKARSLIEEALHRGNSIYLVDRVVMMIPTELTTRICSLNPKVDRLAHTAEIRLDDDGDMVGLETCRSIIHSDARLTYEQVQALFDGRPGHNIPDVVVEVLEELRPLTRSLHAKRSMAGSLEINTPEIKCLLGKAERSRRLGELKRRKRIS